MGTRASATVSMGSSADTCTACFVTADTCPARTKPLPGYVVPPGTGVSDPGVEVLLPITVTRRGKSRIDGVSVVYTSGRRSYTVDDLTNVVACTYACDARPGGR